MNYDYEFTIPKTSDALVRGFGPWDGTQGPPD